jgi:hypothetical protein
MELACSGLILIGLASIVLIKLIGKWTGSWMQRRRMKNLIYPTSVLCPNCKYNLTGNLSGRCPECGGRMGDPSELDATERH